MSETSKKDTELKPEDINEETINSEFEEVEVTETSVESELQDKVDQLEREKAEFKDKWLRSAA